MFLRGKKEHHSKLKASLISIFLLLIVYFFKIGKQRILPSTSEVQGHPQLHRKQVSPRYMRSFLKKPGKMAQWLKIILRSLFPKFKENRLRLVTPLPNTLVISGIKFKYRFTKSTPYHRPQRQGPICFLTLLPE